MLLSQLIPTPGEQPDQYPAVTGSGHFETYIVSDVVSNTTLIPEDSPYIINHTINVSLGSRLIVAPGCEILFGPGSGIIVQGELLVGEEGDFVLMRGGIENSTAHWDGIEFQGGSRGRMDGVIVSGANRSMKLDAATDIVIRNSTFIFDNIPLELNSSSLVHVSNSSMAFNRTVILDNGSMIRTHHFLGGEVVDHMDSPVGDAKVEITDLEGTLHLSYITNSTGEVPSILLEGIPIKKDERSMGIGTYNISVTDDGQTHFSNISMDFNGTMEGAYSVRFSWPPELIGVPGSISIVEDRIAYKYCTLIDRNMVGDVDVLTSSPRVLFNATMERLEFFYTNETYLFENVTVTVNDGYDSRNYTILVRVNPVDDPPQVTFQGGFLYPREDEPAYYSLDIYDEDTSPDEILVTTDDPGNVTYDNVSGRLVFLYCDGTPLEFSVNITISDGNSTVRGEVYLYFQPVYYEPEFLLPLPEIATLEDVTLVLDLGPYLMDPDSGERTFLSARTTDHDIFSPTVDGTVLSIVPAPDAYGKGILQLMLKDERDLMTMVNVNVTVTAVDDEPTLLSPSIEPGGDGMFWFNITYGDVDGDLPEMIWLILDNTNIEMGTNSIPAPDPTSGVSYWYRTRPFPGPHNVSFLVLQGPYEVRVDMGEFIVPDVERVYQVEAYNGSVHVTIWATGEGDLPFVVEDTSLQVGETDIVSLGCSFRIARGNVTPVKAWVTIWPFHFRSDVQMISLRVVYLEGGEWIDIGSGIYDSGTRTFSFQLSGVPLNSTIGIRARLDPDFDSDSDGVKNLLDMFPDDPLEWNDTDLDGTGDNADHDDDNDGFNDTLEEQAGTDPLSSRSFPVDTDLDGILDHEDTDDDNDGMPDVWEVENGLDPLDYSDADDDPDDDGMSNLEEFIDGTDPLRNDTENELSGSFPLWIYVMIGIALIFLIIVGLFLLMKSRRRQWEEIEEVEDQWNIQGELDQDEAIDCPECGSIYPLWFEECPKCGEINPFEE